MTDKHQNTSSIDHPFKPISNKHSRILILGTMPSIQSRKSNFYYAHPRNRFWPVLAACLKQQIPQSTEDKTNLLLKNNIALWDVLASCEISGSDDSTIQKPIFNDIATFISTRPISKIICNGKKSYSLCQQLNLNIPISYTPSTSPANAAWNIERLINAWKLQLIDC